MTPRTPEQVRLMVIMMDFILKKNDEFDTKDDGVGTNSVTREQDASPRPRRLTWREEENGELKNEFRQVRGPIFSRRSTM